MIAIVNVSPKTNPLEGIDDYEVRINRKLICKFKHYRKVDGLAQCLRDAADAVDASKTERLKDFIASYTN